MDLGALELQIFVSLVVVLGSAFVALVCDYLKGNNEQLRERNIELRVRTEEQERFAILNPSAWLSQFRGTFGGGSVRAERAAAVVAEAVMPSYAPAEWLAYAAHREAALAQRSADDGYRGEIGVASIPDVAGFDVAERRRARRKRGNGKQSGAYAPGSNSYDWVRPEVMARVSRGASNRSSHEAAVFAGQLAERVKLTPALAAEAVGPLPVAAVAVPEPTAAPVVQLAAPMLPVQLQTEIERVSRTDYRPAASAPSVIMLRPLPSLKLNEELQRIAETVTYANEGYASQLLDDVIAASAFKPTSVVVEPMLELAALVVESVAPAAPLLPPAVQEVAAEAEVAEAEPTFEQAAMAQSVQESIYRPELAFVPSSSMEEPIAAVEELPLPSFAFEPSLVRNDLASEAPVFVEAEHPMFAEAPARFEFPTYDALPPVAETPAYDWAHAEFAPVPETVFASKAFAAQSFAYEFQEERTFDAFVPVEPRCEVEPEPISVSIADLLLPTGMQDMATYLRLLEMPNPMTGIVITISINEYARLSSTVSASELPGLLGSVETLMGSMVREGDFGVKVSDEQWVFVYRIDSQGFSQRRVAGLSEKLWDFQLRHLGLSNLSFSWAAVNVKSERLQDSVTAAIERMDSSRRGSKKPVADRARLVVNG